MRLLLSLALLPVLCLPMAALAQPAPLSYHMEPYALDTGLHSAPPSEMEPQVVYSTVVEVPDAPWLRLYFSDANLGSGSYLTVTSLYDNARQDLNAEALAQWQNTSAYFNGEALEVQLYVAPGDQDIFVRMEEIMVGDHGESKPSVQLISFDAQANGEDVALTWKTSSEKNNAGFEIQMRKGDDWHALGFVEGHGTTTEAQTYSYTAEGMDVGTHTFRLKQIDFDGAFEYSPEVEATIEVVGTHQLSNAYPNPFNPQSQFRLAVAQDQHVTAELYNTIGQRVVVLFSGALDANQSQIVTIAGAGLASGMYVVRVNGERFSDALSVTLLK